MSSLNTPAELLMKWIEDGEPILGCESEFAKFIAETAPVASDRRYAQPWNKDQTDAIIALASEETRPDSPEYYCIYDLDGELETDAFDFVTKQYFYDSALVHIMRAGLKSTETAYQARYNAIVCFMCYLAKET